MTHRLTQRNTTRKRSNSRRKERVTVTLSPDSAAYVKMFSAQERLHVSTAFEMIIADFRRAREVAQLNRDIASFYDSLPDAAVQEQEAWGAIGSNALADMFEAETVNQKPDPGKLK
jgi:hypothetical protein